MPVLKGSDKKGSYYRWGKSGKRYYFQTNDASSRKKAKVKASRQGKAIKMAGGFGITAEAEAKLREEAKNRKVPVKESWFTQALREFGFDRAADKYHKQYGSGQPTPDMMRKYLPSGFVVPDQGLGIGQKPFTSKRKKMLNGGMFGYTNGKRNIDPVEEPLNRPLRKTKGAGLFEISNKAPPTVKRIMDKIGEYKIINIIIVRQPIQSFVSKSLNGLTLGKFEDIIKEKGYDKMFHLSMFVRCEPADGDGSKEEVYKFEKNAIVSVSKGNVPSGKGVESKATSAPGNRKVKDLFAKQNDPEFWLYDAFKNNCQDFIVTCLKSVGAGRPEVLSFVKQDAEDIGKKLGWFTSTIAKTATDLGARISGAIDKVKDTFSGGSVEEKAILKGLFRAKGFKARMKGGSLIIEPDYAQPKQKNKFKTQPVGERYL